MHLKRPKISYANVVSTLALFIALGGTAVATGVIDGKKIKRGSITGKQIKKRSVPGADLKPNSVRGRQILETSLGRVPSSVRAGSAGFAEVAARAESSAVADQADGLSSALIASLTDTCPAGTVPYAGACLDSSARGPSTWPTAAKTCGDAGGRLPGLAELEGFRQQPGVTLDGTEHTAAYLDLNGLASGGEMTVGITDSGSLSPGLIYGTSNARFRCAFPATNQ